MLDEQPQLRGLLDPAGHLSLSVHSWVVEWAGQLFLIDTGIGNDKERAFNPLFHRLQTPFLQRLAAAGVQPEQVDHVLLTHLHADHVGWNTRLVDGEWRPTFPMPPMRCRRASWTSSPRRRRTAGAWYSTTAWRR